MDDHSHNKVKGLILRILSLKIMSPVSALLRMVRIWRLSLAYGKEFRKTHIGRIDTYCVSFPFYSWPELWYLNQSTKGFPYEPSTVKHMIESYGNRPVCFIDIGAHYGYFSALFGALNSENMIYAFEPNPEAYATLLKNISLNCPRGKTYQIAFSDECSRIAFEGVQMLKQQTQNAFQVPTIPFDIWREKEGVNPDLVKIDVHGGEGKVLFGMVKSLKDLSFPLYLEIHPQELIIDYSLNDILSLIFNSGYEMFELPEFRRLSERPRLIPVDENRRAALSDPEKWTSQEKTNRRMFYCRKP